MNVINCITTSFKDTYKFLLVDLADPRTNHWFLVKDLHIFAIVLSYLYFVNSLGPRLMKDRKPFDLKKTLMVYNFIQVIISIYLFYEALDAVWLRDYSYRCQPVDFSNTPKAMRVASVVWTYYIAKVTELLDTIFFVLRKKNKQITFLHKYHHSVMPLISWGCVKYFPGGHGTFIGFINSFVHIIMYFYYLMAAMGPRVQKYLWWKKYITTLQLLQFCIAFIHSMQLLFYDCGYPRWSTIFTLPNSIFFYYLFNDFYSKAYAGRDQQTKAKEALKNGSACSNGLSNGTNGVSNNSNYSYGHQNGHKMSHIADNNGSIVQNGHKEKTN